MIYISSFLLSDFNKYCNSSKGLKAFLLQCKATIKLLQFLFYILYFKNLYLLDRSIPMREASVYSIPNSNQWNKTQEVVFCNQLVHHLKKTLKYVFQLNFNNIQNTKSSCGLYYML
jgi:hypothetical protein